MKAFVSYLLRGRGELKDFLFLSLSATDFHNTDADSNNGKEEILKGLRTQTVRAAAEEEEEMEEEEAMTLENKGTK